MRQKAEADVCEVEVRNASGLNNSRMSPCKGNESAEEGVGIGGRNPDAGPSQSKQNLVEKEFPQRKRSGPKRKPRSKEEDQIQSTKVAEADVCKVAVLNVSRRNNSRMSTCKGNESEDEGVGIGGRDPDGGPTQSKQNSAETKFPQKKISDLKRKPRSKEEDQTKSNKVSEADVCKVENVSLQRQ